MPVAVLAWCGYRRGMSRRWTPTTIAPQDLPLVVLWKEMLAATGLPAPRAWQLVQEGTFPIPHLPYFGYHARGRRPVDRRQIDVASLTFSKAQVWKFIALDEHERERLTLLEWELPTCCHCPFHCPPAGAAAQSPSYADRFKRRWWSR